MAKRDSRRWAGFSVVCMGSGPSLTPEDAELVRHWRAGANGRRVVVTNTTFKLAPWADVLMAIDTAWWQVYAGESRQIFQGERISDKRAAAKYVDRVVGHPYSSFGNSGTAAASLAIHWGAARVILLGYDAQRTDGKTHHHGPHPAPLSDAQSIKGWPRKFSALALIAKGRIVNCSRVTALKMYRTARLEDELNQGMQHAPEQRTVECALSP